jgi:antitoxin HigA-1
MATLHPVHPGEILREEFLIPMEISAYRLAKDIGVPVNRISAITHEERAITAETGLLLARYFGTSDALWINLQAHYDMECARDSLKKRLKRIPTAAAATSATL